MSMTCPICGKPAGARPVNKSAPFCSVRCRQIDLGKWLDGEYRVPVEDSGTVEEEEASAPERRSREPS